MGEIFGARIIATAQNHFMMMSHKLEMPYTASLQLADSRSKWSGADMPDCGARDNGI